MNNIFKGSLGDYEIIKTQDSSITLKSLYFDEACHSLQGAKEETLYNYILGCDLKEKAKNLNEITVFEVGFGLGVGYQALCEYWKKEKLNTRLNFYSCELDESLVEFATENTPIPSQFAQYKDLNKKSDNILEAKNEISNLTIIIGDIRKQIKKVSLPKCDAIFQDAFSPKKNPALWSVEWFIDLKKISKDEVILSTYSASNSVQKSLIEAGWFFSQEKGFSRKRAMTKAFLKGEISQELLDKLKRSPSLAIYDSNL